MKNPSRLRRLVAVVAAPLAVMSMAAVATATAARAAPLPAQPKAAAASAAADYTSACPPMHKGGFTCFSKFRTNVKEPNALAPGATAKGYAPGATPAGYGPSDIQSAYDIPAATGSPTVAIVDAYDDPDAESDLAVYRAQYGLPACTTANGCFRKVAEDGSTNYPGQAPSGDNWGIEESLDLDAVSAACPACHILLVEANSDQNNVDLPTAVQEAQKLGAQFISMSWGGPEDGTENSEDAQYLDDPGVVMAAASGDNSYSAGPIWPSTSQYTVSVGGTTLTAASGTTRGWSESAWSGAGSGCSLDVTQPSWQSGVTPCTTRAATDISADADPNTGLAIYDSYSSDGWGVVGGTSLATPLIASMYATAGTPAAGTSPASYLYEDKNAATDLNDVTSGSTGTCTPAVMCTAGPGWDGPTGVGTPNGIGALNPAHGDVTGTVTDAGTGKPVPGATVSLGGNYTTTTSLSGAYDLAVPAGSYSLTVTDWGYANGTASGITVTTGGSVTQDITLTAVPTSTISGTVTDGSGHKWPIRAKITVSGDPSGPVYSDPYTGDYSVTVPDNASYTLSVSAADLPGYTSQTATVPVGTSDVTQNLALTIDSTCTAPGYAFKDTGTTETFTGWTGNTPQDGWSVTDNDGSGITWRFDNPSYDAPLGDAAFASVDESSTATAADTSLTSPVLNLSGTTPQNAPEILFDSSYIWEPGQNPGVDLSLDGGATWETNIWTPTVYAAPSRVGISIPQAAGDSDVMVRFHWTFNPQTSQEDGRHWSIGNVFIGQHTCEPVPGGLVEGVVSDANTGDPVNGATVTSNSDSSESAVTGPTSADPGMSNGYYWLFSSNTGSTAFTLTAPQYASTQGQASVTADAVTQANLKIDAGRLTISAPTASVSETLGATKTKSVTFGNSGTAPVHVSLSGDDAGFTAMGATASDTATGTAPMVIKAKVSLGPKTGSGTISTSGETAQPATGPWTSIANYETTVFDDSVAQYDGKVYVVGGSNGTNEIADANVYDPSAGTWSAIAPLPEPLGHSAAGFIGGTLYVAGGWGWQGVPSSDVWAYNAGTNSWSQVASLPTGVANAGSAVVGGKLYVIGGVDSNGNLLSTVYSYDPGNNSWSQEPGYGITSASTAPVSVSLPACSGVDALVVCAGGAGASGSLTSTYTFSPGSSDWAEKTDMPYDAVGAAATTANGQLDVLGGVIENQTALTNEGYAYDPGDDTWSPLPNSNQVSYRGGAACGLYLVGGVDGTGSAVSTAQILPGYDQCGGMPQWMSLSTTGFDINPGQKVTLQVTADSSVVSQPGTYAGQVVIAASTPYPTLAPIGVTMQVTPPKAWGKVTGTVTDASGAPISGATVAICTAYVAGTGACGPTTFTLTTDSNGNYQLWLNKNFSPLEIIAADNGYTPIMKTGKIKAGGTVTVNFSLSQSSTASAAQMQHYLDQQLHLTKG